MELDNWQTTLGNCKDKLTYILNTSTMADVSFVIGEEGEVIKAHSLILRISSPVFDVMLSGRWGAPLDVSSDSSSAGYQSGGPISSSGDTSLSLSSSATTSFTDDPIPSSSGTSGSSAKLEGHLPISPADGCLTCKRQSYVPRRFHPYSQGSELGDGRYTTQRIELPHLEPVSFRLFLKFIYTDEFDVPLEYALFVWHLAEFYNVPLLTEKCEVFILNSLEKENALMVYQNARAVHNVTVAQMAFQYVLFNARLIFQSEDFLNLTHENLMNLLKEDRLNIEEASVFLGVYAWAEAECTRQNIQSTPENIRQTLGEAFDLIRFPLIPAHRFTLDVVPRKLLSDDELISLYKYITLPATERTSWDIDLGTFNNTERRHVFHLSRFSLQQQLNPRFRGYGDEVRQFCFAVDHDIQLVGVGLYASSMPSETANFEIDIELRAQDDDTVLAKINKLIPPRKIKHSIVPLLFLKPVELAAGSYSIHYKVQGPDTFFNTCQTSKTLDVMSGPIRVTFKFFSNRLDCALQLCQMGVPIPEIYFVV